MWIQGYPTAMIGCLAFEQYQYLMDKFVCCTKCDLSPVSEAHSEMEPNVSAHETQIACETLLESTILAHSFEESE